MGSACDQTDCGPLGGLLRARRRTPRVRCVERSAVRLHAVLMAISATTFDDATQVSSDARKFATTAARFLLIAASIYIAFYIGAEQLVYRYAQRNRFFAVRSASPPRYDFVVLGASHAAVFDYRDMNRRLEQMTGAKVLNLSVVGGGVTVNRLLFDYFLTRHQTACLVYVVDSF